MGEAVARAARERSEQERETPRPDATGLHLPAYVLSRLARSAAVLALTGAAACGSPEFAEPAADPLPPTSAAVAEGEPAPSTSASSTPKPAGTAEVPSESVPEVSVPEVSVPEVSVPEVSVPEVSVPEVSVPEVSAPEASVPEVPDPEVSAPEVSVATTSAPVVSVATTSVPEVSAPEVSVPEVSVATTSVPEVSVPEVSLSVAAEYGSGYDRNDWGPHNSGICRGAAGTADPYTGTPIDTCNVDHVVALHEAHESGGWEWPASAKRRFSQDPANHVASRACVNQSKGGDDISEWSDADIARSSACGGGYRVTVAGRCFLALTTVAVKSEWDLAVDQAEADALAMTLARCGDQVPEVSAEPQEATVTATPPTTVAPPAACVIAGKTAAQYDAVSGIGAVLSARLADAQPFSSRADLQAVRGIGPVKAEAVWSHFCGRQS